MVFWQEKMEDTLATTLLFQVMWILKGGKEMNKIKLLGILFFVLSLPKMVLAAEEYDTITPINSNFAVENAA